MEPSQSVNATLLNILLLIVGLALVVASTFTGDYGLLLATVGLGLAPFGLFFLSCEAFSVNPTAFLKQFSKDCKGVAWLWATAIATLIMCPIVWFMVMVPTNMVVEFVQDQYAFSGSTLQLVNLGMWVLDITLGLVVFGVVFYVLVNSNWRDTQFNY